MNRQRESGFTLIEIMVVVFIIGIILTFARLSIGPSEGRLLHEEARRIATLLTLAQQEAVLNAQELALAVTEEGYSFQLYDGVTWTTLQADSVLRPRTLPERMVLDVLLDGEESLLKMTPKEETADEKKKSSKEKEEEPLRILMLSSGEVSPFEILFHYAGQEDGYRIRGTLDGTIAVNGLKVSL